MEMVKTLRESQQYDTAMKLLKHHEPKVLDDLEAAYQVKMEIMHILYLQVRIKISWLFKTYSIYYFRQFLLCNISFKATRPLKTQLFLLRGFIPFPGLHSSSTYHAIKRNFRIIMSLLL